MSKSRADLQAEREHHLANIAQHERWAKQRLRRAVVHRDKADAYQRVIDACRESVAMIDAELAELDAQAWPQKGDKCFVISSTGAVHSHTYKDDRRDRERLAAGNIKRYHKTAERELLRRQSMKPTIPVPKVGDIYWCVSEDGTTFYPCPEEWEGSDYDHNYYNLGRVFATKEECQAWIDQFGPAWTTGEDAE